MSPAYEMSPAYNRMSPAYSRYALGAMTAVYTLNLVDRGLMALLLQPIKEDLQLSDTRLGFLTGIAFGLFYAVVGVPIARWADRGNRVTIASLAIGLWGLTIMASLWVTQYLQLLAARVMAAVGESGCKPPTYSLIGDYFPQPAERTRALAVYTAGSYLANPLSLIVGGWLFELYGWRTTFFLMGIPGLLLAIVIKLTLIEPRTRTRSTGTTSRTSTTSATGAASTIDIEGATGTAGITASAGRASNASIQRVPPPSMRAVLNTLWHRRSWRHLCLALILFYTMSMGLAPWYASFMVRSHGMGTGELGIWLGAIFGLGGIGGALAGGFVGGRWFGDDDRGQMRVNGVLIAALTPFYMAFLLVPQKHLALLTLVPITLAAGFILGPTYALMQRLVADRMRATMMAVVMLLANLVGFGIGPQAVGVLSDLSRPLAGNDSLRYAMLALSFLAPWSGYHFWRVGQVVKDDLAAARMRPA